MIAVKNSVLLAENLLYPEVLLCFSYVPIQPLQDVTQVQFLSEEK